MISEQWSGSGRRSIVRKAEQTYFNSTAHACVRLVLHGQTQVTRTYTAFTHVEAKLIQEGEKESHPVTETSSIILVTSLRR